VPRVDQTCKRPLLLIGGIIIPSLIVLGVLSLVIGGTASPPRLTTASVLDANYAKRVGFPKTLQSAKKTKVTTQKGCTDSVESVYEDAVAKTALLAEVLACRSHVSAAASLAAARKESTIDKTVLVPKDLGKTAFATSEAPEYIIAWQAGSRLVFTAIDVNVNASSTIAASSPSLVLTASQRKVLTAAAIRQNSLLH
jgi:hypothetical protein